MVELSFEFSQGEGSALRQMRQAQKQKARSGEAERARKAGDGVWNIPGLIFIKQHDCNCGLRLVRIAGTTHGF